MTDSPRKMVSTVLLFMPSALRIPISRVRSINETSMMFIMPIPATKSEIAAIPPRNNCRMLKMFVSKLSTAVADITDTWLLKWSVIALETLVTVALSLFLS
jgi:hypothetical protein